jgi:hypothetical protein
MIRILLPLAVVAAVLLGPLLGHSGEIGGISKTVTLTGGDYLDNTIKCWRAGTYSIKGDCEPEGGLAGVMLFASVAVSAAAALIGVLGLLPFLGRLTSAATTLAGVIVVATIGYYAMTMLGKSADGDVLQWGIYAAGGLGLLTLISGLSGLRGR